MEKAVKFLILLIFVAFLNLDGVSQDNPASRRITVKLNNVTLSEALTEISKRGNFLLSYNADGIDVNKRISINEINQPAKKVLQKALGDGYTLRSGGSHIIIIPDKNPQVKPVTNEKYKINGSIKDALTGEKISFASVYEVGEFNTTLSNTEGIYQMNLKGNPEFVRLLISRKNYRDTVIIVKPEPNKKLDVRLKPAGQISELKSVQPELPAEIADNGLFRAVVSEEQLYATENRALYEQRTFQIGFVPILGTNRNFGGLIENHISLNLFGGYSMALTGFELAGFFNITRKHVNGVQIGGFMNITGGSMKGVQLGGFMNNNVGAINGVQAAGFYNLSLDSLEGVQMAGFFNMAKTRVKGVQASGFINISGKELKGVQVAGFQNISGRSATGAQVAGFCNIARGDLKGAQISGFYNLNTGNINGAQITGGINVCPDSAYTIQVAGIANFAKRMKGIQVAGVFNIAGRVDGSQIGLVNICDSVKGIPLGLVSIVRQGYHKFEVSSGDFNKALFTLRTGVHHFYNIISAGMFDPSKPGLVTFGYGVGTELRLGRKFFFGLDAVQSIVFNESIKSGYWPDLWARSNLYIGYRPVKWFEFFGGPTFNTLKIDSRNIDGIHPVTNERLVFNQTNNGIYKGWWGWQAGIRLF